MYFGIFLVNLVSDKDFPYNFDWAFDLHIYVSRDIDLNYPLLKDWDVDYLLYLNDLVYNLNPLYNFFYNLGHFNDFLYDSGDDNNFLYDPLYLYNFRDLNEFLNDLLNDKWDSLDSFDHFLDRDDPVLDYPYDLGLLHEVVDDSLYLLDPVLVNYLSLLDLHLSVADSLNCLDHWLLNYLPLNPDHFVNQGHLDYPLDDLLNSPVLHHRLLNDLLDLLYPIPIYNLLHHHLNLNRLLNYVMYLHDLLNDLGHFNDLLHYLDDWHYLLDYPVHRLIPDFDVVPDVRCRHILHPLNYLLHNFLDLNDFWHLDPHLNDLLYDLVYWNRLLDNLLGSHDFLPDELDVPVLNQRHDHFPLYLPELVHLHRLLDEPLHLDDLRDFSDHFHNLLNYLGDFDDPLLNARHFDQLLNNQGLESGDLDGHVDGVLNHFILLDLDRSLHSSLHLNYPGHLDDSLHYFLDYLLNLYDLGGNPINLENVVYIDYVHDLLPNHAEDPLVHFWDYSTPRLDLLHFLE